jgi:hypothetical protein
VHSQIFGPTQVFLAAIVLALNILQNPQKRMVLSDLELLTAATECAEDQYRRVGQHATFISACSLLRERVRAVLHQKYAGSPSSSSIEQQRESMAARSAPRLNSPWLGSSGLQSGVAYADMSPGDAHIPNFQTFNSGHEIDPNMFGDSAFLLSESLPLEQLWAMMGGDFPLDDIPPGG